MNQASGTNYPSLRSQLFRHGNEKKTQEQQNQWLVATKQFLQKQVEEAGYNDNFIYTPNPKLARVVELYNIDQQRVSETILVVAKAIYDEQEADPKQCFNGIGTLVSKL